MRADQRQRGSLATPPTTTSNAEPAAATRLDVFRADVSGRLKAVTYNFAVKVAAELAKRIRRPR